MRRWLLPAAAVLFLAVIGAYTFGIAPVMNKHKEVREMQINDVNLSRVDDGVYQGEFSYANFTYKVEVAVADRRITKIRILQNRESSYAKMAEGVADQVLASQSLQVDGISGATTTSKALLKAMENALSQK